MRAPSAILVALATLSAATDATSLRAAGNGTNGSPEIVGGVEAAVGKHLYIAGLRETATGGTFCGGALIAPKYVLTAGHCISDDVQYVALGTHYASGSADGERIRVTRRIVHPDYFLREETPFNDWAILELAKPATVKPIKVTFDDSAVGTVATVRGWGSTRSGGAGSNVLKEVSVKIWDNAKCDKAIQKTSEGTAQHLTDTMVCAGGVRGQDSCQGDSGGPFTVKGANGEDVITGVVSWGYGCALQNTPGVYARLSKARDFISPYLSS
ncbi:hypothetical protein SPRG_22224 [Saprolegnia parasitica CBS 223.65]|uniref:Peptidase S1 domain-containing protein n=1 Tax=Saprolegnia parasitica (strain CBS 223.65) TaxID=695850 RepID=A0A067C8K6_SAPPC|nr:hypothetical protein SPRG_22224 [Saprolegnia parasitica CBS 223.65]KDO25500.1 hypothetical protein SPRG_22224 [Saprolegnia parasitica CBS 223.65]|eukprot:XP_012203791.1 hypothetical protein SPRG_22224 [Saprolegnia parasitica CBS 223.65]